MADEKSKNLTDTEQKKPPVPEQPEAAKAAPTTEQEQPKPEVATPEKDKAPEQKQPAPDKAPTQETPAKEEKTADAPKEPQAASVSVFNFAEIMAEKQATEKATGKSVTQPEAKAPEKSAPAKDTGQEQAQPSKRRGRPPKEDKTKAPTEKGASKQDKAAQKPAKSGKAEKATPADKSKKPEKAPKASKPAKAAPEGKAPVQSETPPAPAEAPRPGKDEQIVYLKLSDLHAFKNHPFQVRNDEEMKAMVSSVKDKGVTQPAIVRPLEGGGYEIVSGHRRQKASELAGFTDMPCIVRNLTDEQAITQMVEDNMNQRETILPSEKAKALKMQLEAIKHQGAKDFTSGQLDPKDAGRRSNEVVAERNKMTVKQVQRYIKLNDLVPELSKMMDEGQIKFTPAVELSYIKPKNQKYIAVAIESEVAAPSLSQAQRMRELDQKGVLNGDVIDGIMMEDKKEVDKVILTGAELGKYFGKETTPREMKDQIIKLLDDWKGQQKEVAKPEKKAPEAEK
jgi:ParB family chromosome partitioning protein